jgi:hypothetical protein
MSESRSARIRDHYLCRFVSTNGDRVLVAGIVARDPSIAMARFVTLHASGFDAGSIEILEPGGKPLLTQSWSSGPR